MFINEEFECDVSLFYSLKHGKYNLEGVLDRVYDDNGLNNSYFPFASSGSGSLYVFSLKEKDYGVVYLDHMDDSDIVKLSDSFSGFLDNLQELDWQNIKELEKLDEVDDLLIKIGNRNVYNSKADPVFDILGPAYKSHPRRAEEILETLKAKKVEIIYKNDETLAYAPLRKGEPGQIHIHKEASISALENELRHFLDDESNGFLGGGGLYDINNRVSTELNAYSLEIDFVKKLADDNSSTIKKLKDNFREELDYIEDFLNEKVTDSSILKRINDFLICKI